MTSPISDLIYASLLPHQRIAADAAARTLASGGRGQVIMPCGTGKTLVGVATSALLDARLMLVAVPTLALIRQTAAVWRHAYRHHLKILFACSDGNLANREDLDTLEPSAVAAELDAPVTTDPIALGSILAAWSHAAERSGVAFATYASLDRVLTAARKTGRCFDLVIADEAHHCAGPWSAPWTALARYGSRDDIPARRRLFLTATRRLNREGDYTASNAAMDDPAAFGHVLYQLPLPQAIRLGLLSDYRVAVVGMTHQKWSTPAGSLDLDPLNGRVPYLLAQTDSARQITLGPRMLAATFALGRAMTRYQLRRVLTFHARIRDARAYAAAAPGLLLRSRHPDGPRRVTASAVYADMPAERRAELIRKFDDADEAHAVIVSNVRCLSEGVDIPALDAVMFADPRRGLVDVVQAVGRVMRPHPGKAAGIVVLPVILPDHAPGLGQPGGGASFTDLIHILRALREHDTALAAQLDELRQAAGRRAYSPLLARPLSHGGPLRLLLPRGLPDSFIGAFTLHLLAGTTAAWHERYGALRRWTITHSHSNVPVAEVFGGIRLGGWVHEQRSLKARGLLDSSRRDKLEQLPGWEWTPRDAAWERAFRLLIDYVDGHGTSRVPQTYRVSNFALGAWVKAQRELQQNGRLARYREHKLATLPGWYWRSPRGGRTRPAARSPRAPGARVRGLFEDHQVVCLSSGTRSVRAASGGRPDPVA